MPTVSVGLTGVPVRDLVNHSALLRTAQMGACLRKWQKGIFGNAAFGARFCRLTITILQLVPHLHASIADMDLFDLLQEIPLYDSASKPTAMSLA